MLYASLKPTAATRTGAKAGSAADLLDPHNSKGLSRGAGFINQASVGQT